MAPEARFVGLYSKSAPAHTVEPLGALRTDTALGLGGEFVTVGRGQNQGCADQLRRPTTGLTAVETLRDSALEYHSRVAGQPEAAVELWEVSDTSRRASPGPCERRRLGPRPRGVRPDLTTV